MLKLINIRWISISEFLLLNNNPDKKKWFDSLMSLTMNFSRFFMI